MLNKEDQDFLKQYVSSFKLISESTCDVIGSIFNLEHEVLYRSPFASAIVGISDSELVKRSQSPEIVALRNKVVQTHKVVKYLILNQVDDEHAKFFVLSYAPIINPSTKNLVGIYVNLRYVEAFNIWVMLSKYYNTGIATLDKFDYDIKLTEREKQVVFLFLLNLDSNTIADIVSKIEHKTISKNAIDQIFRSQLVPKFNVFSRKALYDKLIALGYYRFVPQNVLRDGFAVEITDFSVFEN